MKIAASVFVGLAALLHFFIFWMESVGWTRPEVWKRFGVADQAAADVTRPMAYNQASTTSSSASAPRSASRTLALFCTGSMVAAAAVLVTTGRSYVRAALTQGTLPLIGFVLALLS